MLDRYLFYVSKFMCSVYILYQVYTAVVDFEAVAKRDRSIMPSTIEPV